MKKLKYLITGLSLGMICALTSACSLFHKHTVVEDDAVAVTCTENGLTAGTHCSECDKILTAQEVIPATGHSFGEWVTGQDFQYRICSNCGFREIQYFDEKPGDSESSTVYGSYENFDLFKKSCKEDGTTLTYNGAPNRLEVNLRSGSYTCDDYTIVIPKRVTSLRLIGETKGNPYKNLQILFETRTADIVVRIENVVIESNRSIIVSETQNINFNMIMNGEKCSFKVTEKAANGATGNAAGAAGNGNTGKKGTDGASAMVINGNCTIQVYADILEIKGGDAGDGGKGSNANTLGNGGKGGKGGDGGYGIKCDGLAKVIVYSDGCEVSVSGGLGGAGGKGGSGAPLYSSGGSGNAGNNGGPGCEIIYATEEE